MTYPGKDRPLVSLIVPIYKTEKYLPACLDSALAQTYTNLEVLLVDDASPDGSAAIAKDYAARDARFHYLRRENGGLSAARNTGLDAATGEWIAFLDSDDVLPPRAIETLLTAVLTHHTAMAMGAYTDYRDVHRLHLGRRMPAKAGVWRGTEAVQRYYVTDGQFLCHMWTKLFHRDVFSAYRFPEGRIYEDNFALPHLLEAAGSVAVVNRSVYHYQVRKGSTTWSGIRRQMDGLDARIEYTDFLREHHPELVPFAHDVTVSFACNLLARMEDLCPGKEEREWREVTAVIDGILPYGARRGLLNKALYAAYRYDPHHIARLSRLAMKLGGFL